MDGWTDDDYRRVGMVPPSQRPAPAVAVVPRPIAQTAQPGQDLGTILANALKQAALKKQMLDQY